jgi:hypothetical protein
MKLSKKIAQEEIMAASKVLSCDLMGESIN